MEKMPKKDGKSTNRGIRIDLKLSLQFSEMIAAFVWLPPIDASRGKNTGSTSSFYEETLTLYPNPETLP